MSYKNSNIYSSRVFAEHPLALWAIDEDLYFKSLIPESAKTINSIDWTISNGTLVEVFTPPSQIPIEDSYISKVYLSASASNTVQILSDEIQYALKFDEEKDTVCFNFFIYIPRSTVVDSVEAGIIVGTEQNKITKEIQPSDYGFWKKVEIVQKIIDTRSIYPFIRINFADTVVNNEANASIFISGISVGQWSESYNSTNTGVETLDIPSITTMLNEEDAPFIKGIVLDPYGFNNEDYGYVLEYKNKLLAETSGLPMLYGSKNNISILPPSNPVGDIPSIIFPGKGFLNKTGKYSNITVEFWLRVGNKSSDQVKIFGPISSNDGIYVGKEFITVKVGKYVKSYFIGQWYRPMLIHFGQSINEIFLMINGEKVISISIEFLESIESLTNENRDYLCFYGNNLVYPFDIDSFGIFPYIVSEQTAKIRFVYGQGVVEQENIVQSFGGNLAYVDFPYAGYSSTISYPDRVKWSTGYFNNLKVDSSGLSLPEYSLPEILFINNSESIAAEDSLFWNNFYSDNFDIQDEQNPFISLIPKNEYSSFDSSIYFSTLDKTSYPTKSIYGIMRASDDVFTDQSILFFSNNNDTNYFEVKLSSGSIQYLYNDIVIESQIVSASSTFAVGVDVDKISVQYPQVSSFFSNTSLISLNLGGSSSGTFKGKIFSLTLNNKFHTDKDQLIGQSGIANKNFDPEKYEYIGTYTLTPKLSNSEAYLDVSCKGYWESSIPMSYFGKYVTLSSGSKVYDLDLIQFNIDIPTTQYSKNTEEFLNYNNSISTKSYMTMQRASEVGMKPYTDYENTQLVGNSRVLDLDSDFNRLNTKFEVCDGTVIFPPKNGSDYKDFYITVHIDVVSHGINTENIKIKKMSFSSLAFDESKFYSINTPTGRSIYPVSKAGDQYVYKRKNPVNIEIESANYFYVTGNSGIQILSDTEENIKNAVSFPINQTFEAALRVAGIQMYLMFNEEENFANTRTIGKIYDNSRKYDILMIPEYGGKRARISIVYSDTKSPVSGITYFLNGRLVTNLVVKPLEWNSILLSFEENSLFLNREIGQIEIYSGVRVNNVAVFSDINQTTSNLVITDTWNDIDDFNWVYYTSASPGSLSATWLSVLDVKNVPIVILSLNGTDVFNTYSGISNAVANDNSNINVYFDSIKMLNGVDWFNFDIKPI